MDEPFKPGCDLLRGAVVWHLHAWQGRLGRGLTLPARRRARPRSWGYDPRLWNLRYPGTDERDMASEDQCKTGPRSLVESMAHEDLARVAAPVLERRFWCDVVNPGPGAGSAQHAG